jgi:hypothetical protein
VKTIKINSICFSIKPNDEKGKGNFKDKKYWTCEEDIESYHDFVVWDLNFSDGIFYSNTAINCLFSVRAVRTYKLFLKHLLHTYFIHISALLYIYPKFKL